MGGRAMRGANGSEPRGYVLSSDTFPGVFDVSSIEQIPNPLAQTIDGIDMRNTDTHFLSQQINAFDDYEWPDPAPIVISATGAAPIQDNAVHPVQIEQIELPRTLRPNVVPQLEGAEPDSHPSPVLIDDFVREIDLIIDSTPPLVTSQLNDAAYFEDVSPPHEAISLENNMPRFFQSALPLIPQTPRIDAPPQNPQPLLFGDNVPNSLALLPDAIPNSPPSPDNNAPRVPRQLASAFAPALPGFSMPALTSQIATPPPQAAQQRDDCAALLQSQLMVDFEGHISQRVGDAAQPRSDTKSPSRFCHVCVRPASRFGFLLCVNISAGTCRKVVCKRCFEEFNWDWNAAANDPFWACSHCSGTCPQRASCFTYNRSNKKRNPRRSAGTQNKRSRKT